MPSDKDILSDEQVAEIEARASAATEGPWEAYYRVSPRGAHRQWHIGNKEGLCQITMHGYERDYNFMAHAREDVPALCRTVKALRSEIVTSDREWQSRLAEVERELKVTKQHRDDLIAERETSK